MQALKNTLRECAALIGVEHNSTTHKEKLIATLGALIAIFSVSCIALSLTSGAAAGLLIASMGASAVLLFVVPHGALSQPWPVFGGHLLSAAIGVLCYRLFPDQLWTPALAVCLAIAAMQYLRCVHPPGGATALAAVIGGADIHALGWGYLLHPVLSNVLGMLAIALVFNNFFSWRRYPAHLMKKQYQETTSAMAAKLELTHEDFEAAMQKMNTFIDLSTEELVELVDLACQHAEEHRAHPDGILPGRHYSNGRLGRFWSVRQIIDHGPAARGRAHGRIIYKTVAGDGAWDTGICGEEDFRRWARFEVELREGRWVKVQDRGSENAA
jgi:CBS domain-containing membrane protein